MNWRMLLCALAAAAAATAGQAKACVYSLMNEEIGPKRDPEEIAADQERFRRQLLLRNTRAAQRQAANGADTASELADMLVPNIQAIYIETSSCGAGEIDWAGSAAMAYEPLAGTPYAGRENEFHPIVTDYGPGTLGPPCNAEFRGRFAQHLRRRLTPGQLKRSFIFLAARRPDGAVQRLMAFEGNGRLPPVSWVGNAEIPAWARRHPTGRALSGAIAGFWRETGHLLAGAESSCPAAFAQWRREQADLIAHIEETLKPRNPKP
jgi:hypothetical protein